MSEGLFEGPWGPLRSPGRPGAPGQCAPLGAPAPGSPRWLLLRLELGPAEQTRRPTNVACPAASDRLTKTAPCVTHLHRAALPTTQLRHGSCPDPRPGPRSRPGVPQGRRLPRSQRGTPAGAAAAVLARRPTPEPAPPAQPASPGRRPRTPGCLRARQGPGLRRPSQMRSERAGRTERSQGPTAPAKSPPLQPAVNQPAGVGPGPRRRLPPGPPPPPPLAAEEAEVVAGPGAWRQPWAVATPPSFVVVAPSGWGEAPRSLRHTAGRARSQPRRPYRRNTCDNSKGSAPPSSGG